VTLMRACRAVRNAKVDLAHDGISPREAIDVCERRAGEDRSSPALSVLLFSGKRCDPPGSRRV
jgi:hypothetical protein